MAGLADKLKKTEAKKIQDYIEEKFPEENSKFLILCNVFPKLTPELIHDHDKMDEVMEMLGGKGVLNSAGQTIANYLNEISDIEPEEMTEICEGMKQIPDNLISQLVCEMAEQYTLLPKMKRKLKDKDIVVKAIIEKYELDESVTLTTEEIFEDVVNSKREIKETAKKATKNAKSTKQEDGAEVEEAEDVLEEKPVKKVSSKMGRAEKLTEEGTQAVLDEDYDKANALFKEAADLGYADAQNRLGVSYHNARGVKKNIKKAMDLYNKAAEQGHAKAQGNLGILYFYGEKGINKNFALALKWLTLSAEQGCAPAQATLAEMYYDGAGVEADCDKAKELWEKAAEQGDACSVFRLGEIYENGGGKTKKNMKEAVKYYTTSAQYGDINAMRKLGELYHAGGNGLTPNRELSKKWLREAAELGDAGASNDFYDYFGDDTYLIQNDLILGL